MTYSKYFGKRTLAILLALIMVWAMMPMHRAYFVFAEEVASGTCGDNLSWNLNSDGVLTILGTGEMTDYTSLNPSNSGGTCPAWFNYRTQIKRVVMIDGVTTIGSCAFGCCSNLSSIETPFTITKIGDYAFQNCESLTSVILPGALTEIGAYAFSSCTKLEYIHIPKSVNVIGSLAFNHCDNLKTGGPAGGGYNYEFEWKEVFPADAFRYLSLDSLTIPSTAKVFDGEKGLQFDRGYTKDLHISDINNWYNVDIVSTMYNPIYHSKTIYENEKKIETLEVPQGITAIKDYLFAGASITGLIIPEGVTEIGDSAFAYCEYLSNISLPSTINRIGGYAFQHNSSLSKITIPASVKQIGSCAFWCNDLLKEVVFEGDAPEFIKYKSWYWNFYNDDLTIYYPINAEGWDTVKLYNWDNATIQWVAYNPQNTIPLDSAIVTVPVQTFTGEPLTPTVTVTLDGNTLTVGTDYTVAYSNNTNAGTATVTVTGIGNYTGTVSKTFAIAKAETVLKFASSSVSIKTTDSDFTNPLTKTTDGTITFSSSNTDVATVNSSTGQVTIKGSGTTTITANALAGNNYKAGNASYTLIVEPKSESVLIINTDVQTASSGNVLLGLRGNYIVDVQNALKKINAIRREACEEGVKNPDTGKPLTLNDYKEIRWSRDLEYIARIRAAESSLTVQHLRTNGNSCFEIQSPNGIKSYGEVLAWNGSNSTIQGIEQWYSEKSDWVNESEGSVTGHYTQMISPKNTYVGLGTFCSEQSTYYNTTAGEFSSSTDLVETPMEQSGECIQILEISKEYLTGDAQIQGLQSSAVNEVSPHSLTIATAYPKTSHVYTTYGLMFMDAEWNSSNQSVAKVNSGNVFAISGGTAIISATSGIGYSASIDFEVVSSIANATISGLSNSVYTGSAKKPTPTVVLNSKTLTKDTDYIVSYKNNTNVGTATVTITGKGNYSGSKSATFKITAASISSATVSGLSNSTYTGSAKKPTPTVVLNSKTLTKDTDYTVAYKNNTNVGTATVTITGKGNYSGSKTANFKITAASVANATVSGLSSSDYTGSAKKPSPTVKVGTKTLTKDTDYTVSYKNNTNVGTATVTITGKGNYTGTKTATFKITAASVSSATVSGLSSSTYTGSAKTPAPTVVVNSKTLTKGTDYTVSYKNNTNVGTATVTITGKGNYKDTKTATFKITKAAQTVTVKSSASSVAVGKTATVTITGNKGTKSFKSSDTSIATVTSAGKVTAKKVGTVKITATSAATANYKAASKTVTIKVVPAATSSLTAANQATGIKLTWKKVTGATGYLVYRGSTKIATISSGSTVTYTDKNANTNGTKYTFKVVAKAGTGNSTLSKSKTLYRVSRPAISSTTNSAAGKMTVKWGKNAKATGYEVQYSTSSTFASGNKTVSVASASTVSKVVSSLTKGKTYYVRVRTYKTVSGVKYYSAWSVKKSMKISK